MSTLSGPFSRQEGDGALPPSKGQDATHELLYSIDSTLKPSYQTLCTPVQASDISAMTMQELLEELQDSFPPQSDIDSLLHLSQQIQAELRDHLVSSPQCMLPSFNYTLPSGQELGTYLAVEVGGSNLRMALVWLRGRSRGNDAMQIRRASISPISKGVRELEEYAFFDWMAMKIREMLVLEGETREDGEPLRMGVAWSFPIE